MTKQRICSRCGLPKSLEKDFAWKNKAKGRYHSHCKSCQSGISHKHYESNRSEYIDRAKQRYKDQRAENEDWLNEYMSELGCAKCTESNPKTLDFVHRPGTEKKDTVRRLLGQTRSILLEEIAKCDLLCANCRRR